MQQARTAQEEQEFNGHTYLTFLEEKKHAAPRRFNEALRFE